MKNLFSMPQKFLVVALLLFSTILTANAQQHTFYLQALEDLRSARWVIKHQPGNAYQAVDETRAIQQINNAIRAIKNASIDDHRDIEDHAQMDERPDRSARLHQALDFLNKAHDDISQEEDNYSGRGLRNSVALYIKHARYYVVAALRVS